jgi:hypothetical protein
VGAGIFFLAAFEIIIRFQIFIVQCVKLQLMSIANCSILTVSGLFWLSLEVDLLVNVHYVDYTDEV